MIHLKMFLSLRLFGLTSGQHSPELLKLILRFILLVTMSVVNFHAGPAVLGWFDWCKLWCDIASSHICIVQVAFAVEPDALAKTTPDFMLGQNCSNFYKATGVFRSNKIPPSSKRSESHLLETSAALSSGLETSVMFP